MPTNEYTLDFEWTDELADEYARALTSQSSSGVLPRHTHLALAIMILAPMAVLAYIWGRFPPELLTGVLILLGVCFGFSWLRRRLHYLDCRWLSLLPFQGLERRKVQVRVSEEQISADMGEMNFQAGWAELAAMAALPGFWIIRLRDGGQVVLPVEVLSPELQEFLRDKAAAAGLKLQDNPSP
ncbi:MAG: hypothetical protein L0Y72_11895 [Gemmataceae bacterium]|nr:hypothetical protein [Gemmataceae bacterium]